MTSLTTADAKRVKVVDDHPGKWHDGLELILASLKIERSGHSGAPEVVIVGFLEPPIAKPVGMFGDREQPLQVLRKQNGAWHFTMSNLGTIDAEDVRHLLVTGEVILDADWSPYRKTLTLIKAIKGRE